MQVKVDEVEGLKATHKAAAKAHAEADLSRAAAERAFQAARIDAENTVEQLRSRENDLLAVFRQQQQQAFEQNQVPVWTYWALFWWNSMYAQAFEETPAFCKCQKLCLRNVRVEWGAVKGIFDRISATCLACTHEQDRTQVSWTNWVGAAWTPLCAHMVTTMPRVHLIQLCHVWKLPFSVSLWGER